MGLTDLLDIKSLILIVVAGVALLMVVANATGTSTYSIPTIVTSIGDSIASLLQPISDLLIQILNIFVGMLTAILAKVK